MTTAIASFKRAATVKVAAVTIEGSQGDQGGDFLPVEVSQFGQLCQQRDGRDISDAGHTLEEAGFLGPLLVRFNQVGDLGLDGFDLLVQLLDHLLEALSHALLVVVSRRSTRWSAVR